MRARIALACLIAASGGCSLLDWSSLVPSDAEAPSEVGADATRDGGNDAPTDHPVPSDGATDASTDAADAPGPASSFCATVLPPVGDASFCQDFGDASLAQWDIRPIMSAGSGTGAILDGSLVVSADAGGYWYLQKSFSNVQTVRYEFDLTLQARPGIGYANLGAVTFENLGPLVNFAQVLIETEANGMGGDNFIETVAFDSEAGRPGTKTAIPIVPLLPSARVHVRMDIDIPAHSATLHVADAGPFAVTLPTQYVVGKNATVKAGIQQSGTSLDLATVVIDDVVVWYTQQ